MGPNQHTDPAWQRVAVDGDGYVYWTATSAIGRAKLDGISVDPSFITGASFPQAVAVDAAHVYWTNNGTNSIGRANLDGTGADQSFIGFPSLGGGYFPNGVAVDNAHLYWANQDTNSIGRANPDGSEIDQNFISAPGRPRRPSGFPPRQADEEQSQTNREAHGRAGSPAAALLSAG